MRIRTVKPEFWTHPVMGRASDGAKLLAIGLLNFADDKGFFYLDPILIRNAIRPFDEDSVSVQGFLNELSLQGYFETRIHPTHGKIGWIVAFEEHQVINRPSKHSMKELWDSSTPHGTLTESSVSTHSGKEGKGKEQGTGKGRDQKAAIATPTAKTGPGGRCTLEEIKAYCATLGLPESDGEHLFEHWEENGWKRGNKPIRNWQASVRVWKTGGYLPSQKQHGGRPQAPAHRGIQEKIEIPFYEA